MNKLTELWRSPYPMFYQRWKAVVIPSVIIFLILYILQPFGISRIKKAFLVLWCPRWQTQYCQCIAKEINRVINCWKVESHKDVGNFRPVHL